MKKYAIYLSLLIILLGGAYYLLIKREKEIYLKSDYKNIEYIISGEKIRLVNGVSEKPSAPGSAEKITTRYFGNEIKKDLDGDGREDVAFLITQTTGGSGTFYYLVGALNKENGYVGTNAVFIGDRIAPQTTNSGDNRIVIVNYADRKPGEPMTAQPSLGKSLYLLLDPKNLEWGEVVQNFEGEADASKMTLSMKQWFFQSGTYNDGKKIVLDSKKFSISFKKDGTFTATTDCNHVGGKYTASKGKIKISDTYTTLMYCEGSKESDFTKLLSQFQIYHFTGKGELVIDLMYDSGSVVFK